MLDLEDNALYQHVIATYEKSEEKLKNENSRLKAMLSEAQGGLTVSDGEPHKKRRREKVPISETDLCEEAIQRKGSAEVE